MAKAIVRVADLRQQVYETLKARITAGGYEADTKFQEIALAQELGVSRTPVREALAMLVRDGLLVQITRGFRLPRFTPEEIAEVCEIRRRLEPYAMRRLIEDNNARTLRALGGRVRTVLEKAGDTEAYAEAHRAVRADIYAHVPNGQLVDALSRYEDSVHYLRLATLMRPRSRRISRDGMLALADAIAEADATRAEQQMDLQIINAQAAFLEYLADEEAARAATDPSESAD